MKQWIRSMNGGRVLVGALLLLGTLSASATASGRIINVPADYSTIYDATYNANDGDEVVVAPGEYHETLHNFNKDIMIRSTFDGDWSVVEKTIIDGGGNGYVAMLRYCSAKCVIRGFTLTNGSGAIDGDNAHATIEYNIITQNSSPGAYYGTIENCDGLIQNNIIENNKACNGGAFSDCDGTIQNNLVRNNTTYGAEVPDGPHHSIRQILSQGGAFYHCAGPIRNNTVVDNFVRANFASDAATTPGGFAACSGPIVNNIVYHTTMTQTLEYDTSSTPSYCLFRQAHAGTGNLAADPRFADPAQGDYRLREDSPAIDAGVRQDGLKADFAGHQRGLKTTGTAGRGDGSGTDLGAYEALPKPVAVWLEEGGPEAIGEGQGLEVGWALEAASAGTAVQLYLARGGQDLADLGSAWAQDATGIQPVALPLKLATANDYVIRAVSTWDPALASQSPAFTITGSQQNAATSAWRHYE